MAELDNLLEEIRSLPDVHPFIERVNWDPEHDKPGLKRAFDEIVAHNVNIHIEFLDDDLCWMSITDPNGHPDDRQIVTFQAAGRGKLIGRTGAE